jgi:hypothetical protein
MAVVRNANQFEIRVEGELAKDMLLELIRMASRITLKLLEDERFELFDKILYVLSIVFDNDYTKLVLGDASSRLRELFERLTNLFEVLSRIFEVVLLQSASSEHTQGDLESLKVLLSEMVDEINAEGGGLDQLEELGAQLQEVMEYLSQVIDSDETKEES